jgi:hypothetical protein
MFEDKEFDVEHALGLRADSFFQLPAAAIYDDEAIKPFKEVAEKCHIYLIGLVPKTDIVDVSQEGQTFKIDVQVLGKTYNLKWDIPEGFTFKKDGEYSYLEDSAGNRYAANDEDIFRKARSEGAPLDFDVQYIGQAYGADGSRNALDRLKKHETLQKIALQGIPDGYRLQLLLLEVLPATTVFTLFNPKAENKDQGDQRIAAGLDKLFGTDEKERVSLFEAAFIRYFRPPFNEKLKDSFPSTNMSVLKDCYSKDFSAVIAEIGFDNLPYELFSKTIGPRDHHIANHDLHTEEKRKVFFSDRK